MASLSATEAAPASLTAHATWAARRQWAWLAFGLVAAATCVLAGVFVGAHSDRDQVDRAVVETVIVGVPVAVGFFAVRFPRERRFGLMLIAAGLIWSLTALASSPDSLPYSVGRVVAWLIFPLLIYLMLAFPEGRLASGTARLLFGSVTALIAVLYIGSALVAEDYPTRTPWAQCIDTCPPNAFMVVNAEPAVMDRLVLPGRDLLGVLLLGAVTWWLLARMRTSSPRRRSAIAPVVAVSLVWLVTLVAYLVVRRVQGSDADVLVTLGRIWSLCVPGIAAAFLVGLLRQRLVFGDVLHRLGLALSRPVNAHGLRAALTSALDDPALDVLLPGPAPGRWVDLHGRVVSVPEIVEGGRAVTAVPDRDAPAVALVHDPALRDDEELLDAVCALVHASLEHERLAEGLATSRSELEDSRERIARIADTERSRIERDLHDGAQQRLVTLRIKLSLAEELLRSDPQAGADAVHELGDEIDLAVEDLRALAHGVYPSLLSDRGLKDALRGAFLDSPLPVHLDARGVTRHPVEIETAVYFVCIEAVQNAVKHATGATGVWVWLHQDETLDVEILDDGPGFAPPDDRDGGLRNMRDRVDAVGGRLTIDAAPGRGTGIIFSVPVDAVTSGA
jgi:signal transduction histidine kinase